jgi:CheY-like chemotaxis protein/chromosome segregation ATPase
MAGNVLIIDAEDGFAGQLASILRDHGLESQQTGDGKLGMDLAKAHVPAAIVLCVELPRMSGYSICAKLKKDAQLKSIPLIITSAEATPETFEHHKKLKTRAEEYLKKPFPPSLLVQVLERYISIPKKGSTNGHAEDVDVGDDLPIEDAPPVTDDEAYSTDAGERHGGMRGDNLSQIDQMLQGLARPGKSGAPPAAQNVPVPAGPTGFEEEDEIMTSVGLLPESSEEQEELRREVEDLKAQVHSAREAQARAERERNEARANEKAAMQAHTGTQPPGASAAREVLAVKKELNAKDKEIFELRDKLHAKDRELLEQKEREMELDTKVVQAEEEKAQAESLRDMAEHRTREANERAQAAEQRASDSERKAQTAEGKALTAERRAKDADARSKEADQRAQQAIERAQAAEAARADAEATLAESHREAENRIDDLNRRLGEAATHEAELDGALQAAHQDGAQMRDTIAEQEASIMQAQEHIQTLRDANQTQNQEITRLTNELSAATAEADGLRQQLQVTQQQLQDAELRLQGLDGELSGQRGENDMLRSNINEMEHDREVSEGRIARAYQKIRDDEKIKGKARKAIEIALALLQEAGYAPDAQESSEPRTDESADEARS